MSDKNRKLFYDLISSNNIPIIEDDIYGDLGFDNSRPLAIKSFDTFADGGDFKGENVIYCNSFSKTVSPGLRVGWISSKKYQSRIEYLYLLYQNSLERSPLQKFNSLMETKLFTFFHLYLQQ